MKIKDLPQDDQDKLRQSNVFAASWEFVREMEVDEVEAWAEAASEDIKAEMERNERRRAMVEEILELTKPVTDMHPNLPLVKAEWFLKEPQRSRLATLMREFTKPAELPPVRDRQPWHDDVEAEFRQAQDFTLDEIVARVLKRDRGYPADAVRRYAEFVLKCASAV